MAPNILQNKHSGHKVKLFEKGEKLLKPCALKNIKLQIEFKKYIYIFCDNFLGYAYTGPCPDSLFSPLLGVKSVLAAARFLGASTGLLGNADRAFSTRACSKIIFSRFL